MAQGVAVFPGDADVQALCRAAGVDPDFDSPQAVQVVLAGVQESSFRAAAETRGVRFDVGVSPVAAQDGRAPRVYFVERGQDGRERACSWTHPAADACKTQCQRILKEEKAREAERLRLLAGEPMPDVDSVAARQQRVAARNAKEAKAYDEALLFYKAKYGNPEVDDVEPVDTGLRYWELSPRAVKRCAQEELGIADLATEPNLAWIVRQYLAIELPPRWAAHDESPEQPNGLAISERQLPLGDLLGDDPDEPPSREPVRQQAKRFALELPQEEGSLAHAPEILFVREHPALRYTKLLIENAREEAEFGLGLSEGEGSQRTFADDEHGGGGTSGSFKAQFVLPFYHFKTASFYYYNFASQQVEGLGHVRQVPKCLREEPSEQGEGSCTARSDGASSDASEEDETQADFEYSRSELKQLVEAADPKDVWVMLTNRISSEVLASFAAHCDVKLRAESTEFLRDIAVALLGPLPQGWVRRLDPDGLKHYCRLNGDPVEELWRHLSNPHNSPIPLPHWAVKAAGLGQKVELRAYEYSLHHPAAEQCRVHFARRRAQLERDKREARIKARQNMSEQQQIERAATHIQPEPVRGAIGEPSEQAYRYYVQTFGDPKDLSAIRAPCTSVARTPRMVQAMARHLLMGVEEVGLFWIAHMRLAVELPPGWRVEAGDHQRCTFVFSAHEQDGQCWEQEYHPADSYFMALATAARETGYRDEANDFLEMVDERGKTYLYNFDTLETRNQIKGRTGPRHARKSSIATRTFGSVAEPGAPIGRGKQQRAMSMVVPRRPPETSDFGSGSSPLSVDATQLDTKAMPARRSSMMPPGRGSAATATTVRHPSLAAPFMHRVGGREIDLLQARTGFKYESEVPPARVQVRRATGATGVASGQVGPGATCAAAAPSVSGPPSPLLKPSEQGQVAQFASDNAHRQSRFGVVPPDTATGSWALDATMTTSSGASLAPMMLGSRELSTIDVRFGGAPSQPVPGPKRPSSAGAAQGGAAQPGLVHVMSLELLPPHLAADFSGPRQARQATIHPDSPRPWASPRSPEDTSSCRSLWLQHEFFTLDAQQQQQRIESSERIVLRPLLPAPDLEPFARVRTNRHDLQALLDHARRFNELPSLREQAASEAHQSSPPTRAA